MELKNTMKYKNAIENINKIVNQAEELANKSFENIKSEEKKG